MATNRDGIGRIRSATLADDAALAQLFASARVALLPLGRADVSACLDRGYLLVLDLGDSVLGGAMHVALDPIRGDHVRPRIRFCVIHPVLAGSDASARIAAAMVAICEAGGARSPLIET